MPSVLDAEVGFDSTGTLAPAAAAAASSGAGILWADSAPSRTFHRSIPGIMKSSQNRRRETWFRVLDSVKKFAHYHTIQGVALQPSDFTVQTYVGVGHHSEDSHVQVLPQGPPQASFFNNATLNDLVNKLGFWKVTGVITNVHARMSLDDSHEQYFCRTVDC